MQTLTVELGERSYPIYIGEGLLEKTGELIKSSISGKTILIVSNSPVFHLYGEIVEASLKRHGFQVVTGIVGAGEEHKNLATAEKLYDLAFASGLDRRCALCALGGGVVGDVAGFVAATYLRGVPLVQLPTTLLAQVDSSVGGKVAVNHPGGKNIIGSFYQPKLVLVDTAAIKTLPPREIKSGLAEIIKYGVIWNPLFHTWLEKNISGLLAGRPEALALAVQESCRIKASVVEQDETEQGLRAILNFGHTLGHAVETLTRFRVFNHGEAVGLGMSFAARLAANLGLLPAQESERITALIRRGGLPVEVPPDLPADALVAAMKQDKKAFAGSLTMVLPVAIGRVEVVREVPEDAVRKLLPPS
ncbi:MAG: 3-dehydroquinate synthase [Firmicutes bacterium ADurb.Bin456]|nr:MAG: 3-dehydroquinate synthase [Firmicutes bacterium ADurb.Bin456]